MTKATSKIRPLSDRVVVTAREQETTTPGGIVIPDSVTDRETSIQGVVIAVGNGKYIEGKIQPLQVKVGDKVLFGKYAGTNVKLDATEYLVMREEDIMGVLE